MQRIFPSRIYKAAAVFSIFFNFSFFPPEADLPSAEILNLTLAPPAISQNSPVDQALAQATNDLTRFVLENGLVVLIKDDRAAPLVSVQVWIGTGSANEQEYLGGGLSHWMEHMIFKGTPTRPPGQIAKAIDEVGGSINAYTANDRTVFLADLPARHWRIGLEVLADALRNASFPEDEWQREKQVILREMAMNQDSPERQLSRLLWETAYRVHPYRVPVIGYPDVFTTLTRQDLQTFFRRHYEPDNMLLVLAGDVRAREAQAAIRDLFGAWPRQARAPAPLPAEPEQIGARVARQTGPYTVTRVAIGWHTVALAHPDAPDLDLLAAIAGNGRSSRLVREIQDTRKLAHEISAWSFTPRDPGLFGISAVCDPDQETTLIAAINAEVRRWTAEPFDRGELEKVRRMTLVDTISEFQTVNGQARNFASGEFYTGSPLYFQTYLQRLERASPDSLLAVARKYLRTDNRTTAVLAPAAAQSIPSASNTSAGPAAVTGAVEKIMLPNGIPLLIREDHKLPLVWMSAVCGGGLILENETNNGITSLMAELLVRGARRRNAAAIAQTVESRGASLTAFVGRNSFGLRAQCLSRDAPALMEVLADCLLAPGFAPDEIGQRKSIQISIIRQQRESPLFIAQEALRQALFPNHPYRFAPEGTPESIASIGLDQVRAWHAGTVVNGNTVLAVFGDISAAQARAMAEKYFQTVPVGSPATGGKNYLNPAQDPANYPQPALPRRIVRYEPREQAVILAGFPGVDLLDPRNDALILLQQALSGLSSELMISIRDKQGLAYYAGAIQQPGTQPGLFAIYAGTRSAALAQVEILMRQEIRRITTDGIRDDELERARNKLITDHAQRLQLNGELALECALNELNGLGYGYSFDMEQRLQALTTEAVRAAAASILNTNRMAIAIVEPAPEELKIKN